MRKLKRSMFRSLLKRKYGTTLHQAMKMSGAKSQGALERMIRDKEA